MISNHIDRRRFLSRAGALAAASMSGCSAPTHAEPPPEVKTIRLANLPAVCLAFGYLAEDILRAEGFEAIEYVDISVNAITNYINSGAVDIWVDAAPGLVNALDSTSASIVLGGIHSGCYELFANTRVDAVRDLKGKSVSISGYGSTEHVFLSSIAAYLGMDPRRDIVWKPSAGPRAALQAFIEGKADAYLGFAPHPHELRALKIGHVILNTTQDKPWSQYFCCMVTANRKFVRDNPVAAKRALRAFLKAADICAEDPARAARLMVERGHDNDYARARAILSELPYKRWRDTNPEDTLRFHALRLHEVGMIKTNPNALIARSTDWRFLNELKRELRT